MKSIDKNLVKGIYTRKLKDFKEDYAANFGNKSLFARLKSEFLSVTSKKEKQVETKFDSREIEDTVKKHHHGKDKHKERTKI